MELEKTILAAISPKIETVSIGRGVISWSIPVAFAITGLAIGYVTGLSETPVIGTLLPLLFAAISGGVGYIAIRRPKTSLRIGVSLGLLSLFLIVGDTWGIALRKNLTFRDFVWRAEPKPVPTALALPEIKDQQILLLLVAVKLHLQSINLPERERELIFQFATDSAKAIDRNALISLDYNLEILEGLPVTYARSSEQTNAKSVVSQRTSPTSSPESNRVASPGDKPTGADSTIPPTSAPLADFTLSWVTAPSTAFPSNMIIPTPTPTSSKGVGFKRTPSEPFAPLFPWQLRATQPPCTPLRDLETSRECSLINCDTVPSPSAGGENWNLLPPRPKGIASDLLPCLQTAR